MKKLEPEFGPNGVFIVDSNGGRRTFLENWLTPVPELSVIAPSSVQDLMAQIRRFERRPGLVKAVLLGEEVWKPLPSERRYFQPDPWRYWIRELVTLMDEGTGLLICTSELEEEHRAVQEYCTRNEVRYGWVGWTQPEKIEDLLLIHLEGL